MKMTLTICLLLATVCSYGQTAIESNEQIEHNQKHRRSEVSLQYSFGFSNRNFQVPSNGMFERLDYQHARSSYDRGYTLRYNFAIVDKGKNRLLLGTGIGYANAQHFQNFADIEYGYLLESVVFDSKIISIPMTIGYERAFYGKRLFVDVSYSMNYNMPLEKSKIYEIEEPRKQHFINYTYSLDVHSQNSRSNYIALTPKFKIINNLFLNCSVGYLSSKTITYNYEHRTQYSRLDLTTGHTTYYTTRATSLPDIEIVDKYLYLSLGFSYKF